MRLPRPTAVLLSLAPAVALLTMTGCGATGTLQDQSTSAATTQSEDQGAASGQDDQPGAGQPQEQQPSGEPVQDMTGAFSIQLPPGFGPPQDGRDLTGAQQTAPGGETSTIVLFAVPPSGSVDAAGVSADEDALLILAIDPAQDVDVVVSGLLAEMEETGEGIESYVSEPIAVTVDGADGAIVRTAVSNAAAGEAADFVNETLVVNHGDVTYVGLLRGSFQSDTTSQRMSNVLSSWQWTG